jgi:hypothetical protein
VGLRSESGERIARAGETKLCAPAPRTRTCRLLLCRPACLPLDAARLLLSPSALGLLLLLDAASLNDLHAPALQSIVEPSLHLGAIADGLQRHPVAD